MARHQPHLLVDLSPGEEPVQIGKDARHHIERVLRFTSGPVTYTDGAGLVGAGVYERGRIARNEEQRIGRPSSLVVAVAPPKDNARARFIVEKLAELGIKSLFWLRTEHTEGRVPKESKTAAWAAAALEQSRGAWLLDLPGAVEPADLSTLGTPVFCDACGVQVGELELPADPVLCVGPEGGFAPGEVPVEALTLSLGPTILRVETAAVVGAALLSR